MCQTLIVIHACRSHSITPGMSSRDVGKWGAGLPGFLDVRFESRVLSDVIDILEMKASSTTRCLRKRVECLCSSKADRALTETVVSFPHSLIHLVTERFIHSRLLCSQHDSEVWECNNYNRQHSCPLGTAGFNGRSSGESTLEYDGIRLGTKAVGMGHIALY